MSHTPAECPFAMLPKELIVNIIQSLKKVMLYAEQPFETTRHKPVIHPEALLVYPSGGDNNINDNNSDLCRDNAEEEEELEAVSLKKRKEPEIEDDDPQDSTRKRSKHKTVY